MSIRPELLSVGQAARLLNVSVDTVRRLGNRGVIPEYRDHRRVRHYRRSDLVQLRDSRRPRLRSGEGRCSSRRDPGRGGLTGLRSRERID